MYEDHLTTSVDATGDDARVAYHRACALRSYFIVFVDIYIFVDKSETYVDVVYIKYFIDLEKIHEYN